MASTYLTRTPSSAGTQTKATISVWLKRSNLTSNQCYFSTGNNNVVFKFVSNDKLTIYDYNGSSMDLELTTTQLFRDINAWYHIVVSLDSTQATASDRAKLYVNGSLISDFDSTTYPTQNYNFKVNGTLEHFIGRLSGLSQYFDGSLAHFHNIDGTAYDADTFGETDSTTGIWKPTFSPLVTYGTNGFFLKFENSAAFGTDSSGNVNNFTVNGTMTQNIDTPSNVFATMNSLVPSSNITFSNGNNRLTGSNADNYSANNVATIGASSGKWYWEVKYTTANSNSNPTVGIAKLENYRADLNNTTETGYAVVRFDGEIQVDGSNAGSSYWGSNPVAGDIIMFALDMDNGKFYLGKNGTWQNSGVPTSGSTGTGSITSSLSGTQTPCIRYLASVFDTNFGNGYFGTTAVSSAQNPDDGIGIFEYSVPTGYKALCTKSINAQEYD
jgi:hypothetical protein